MHPLTKKLKLLPDIFDRSILKFREVPLAAQLALVALIPLLLSFAMGFLARYIPAATIPSNPATSALSKPLYIFTAVLFAPLGETLIFQAGVVYVVTKLLKQRALWAAIASAVLFALDHQYSVSYALTILVTGFSFVFLYLARAYEGGRAFLWVFTAHGLGNALLIGATELGFFRY